MSTSRISSSRRKTRSAASVKSSAKNASKGVSGKNHRFVGVSLSGGKSDKACVAVLEYFPEHKKVFLSRLYEKIKSEEYISADLKIHEILLQYHEHVENVAFDVPLSLPKCMRCQLKCPGFETCSEKEMEWLRDFYNKVNKKKKPKKMFTPYTQRCVEAYISHALEEPFDIQHALGANMAPLTARAHFVQRRLDLTTIEVYPKLTIWRLGQELKVAKSHLRFHRHAVGGDESRRLFLTELANRKGVFFYEQDFKIMIENNHAFEAFLCAYTGLLKFQGLTESRPSGFPPKEAWIEFPR